MERYHMFKLGLAILFYAAYCIRPMLVSGLRSSSIVTNQTLKPEDYNVFYQGVDGTPGVDFPVLSFIPRTTFTCDGIESGYYADLDTDCQVFHICEEGRKISFLCPNGTIFEQEDLICEWWYKVDCANAPNLYQESAEILREDLARRKASRKISLNGQERNHGAVMRMEESASVSAQQNGKPYRITSGREGRISPGGVDLARIGSGSGRNNDNLIHSAIDKDVQTLPQKRFNDASTGNYINNENEGKQVYTRSTTPSSSLGGFASHRGDVSSKKQSTLSRGSVKFSSGFGSKTTESTGSSLSDGYDFESPKHRSENINRQYTPTPTPASRSVKIDSSKVDLSQIKQKSVVGLPRNDIHNGRVEPSDSDELQVPQETAAFTPNSYNTIRSNTRKSVTPSPHPNHRPTYSDLKRPDFSSTKFVNSINSVTPQYITTQSINSGKPFIGSTVGANIFNRNTGRSQPNEYATLPVSTTERPVAFTERPVASSTFPAFNSGNTEKSVPFTVQPVVSSTYQTFNSESTEKSIVQPAVSYTYQSINNYNTEESVLSTLQPVVSSTYQSSNEHSTEKAVPFTNQPVVSPTYRASGGANQELSSTPLPGVSSTASPLNDGITTKTVDYAAVYGSFSAVTPTSTSSPSGVEIKLGKNVDKVSIQLSKSLGGEPPKHGSTVAPSLLATDGFVRITGGLSRPVGGSISQVHFGVGSGRGSTLPPLYRAPIVVSGEDGSAVSTVRPGIVSPSEATSFRPDIPGSDNTLIPSVLTPEGVTNFQSTTARPDLYETGTVTTRNLENFFGTGTPSSDVISPNNIGKIPKSTSTGYTRVESTIAPNSPSSSVPPNVQESTNLLGTIYTSDGGNPSTIGDIISTAIPNVQAPTPTSSSTGPKAGGGNNLGTLRSTNGIPGSVTNTIVSTGGATVSNLGLIDGNSGSVYDVPTSSIRPNVFVGENSRNTVSPPVEDRDQSTTVNPVLPTRSGAHSQVTELLPIPDIVSQPINRSNKSDTRQNSFRPNFYPTTTKDGNVRKLIIPSIAIPSLVASQQDNSFQSTSTNKPLLSDINGTVSPSLNTDLFEPQINEVSLSQNDLGSTLSPVDTFSTFKLASTTNNVGYNAFHSSTNRPFAGEPSATTSSGFYVTRNSAYGSTTPSPFGLSKATASSQGSSTLLINISPNSGEAGVDDVTTIAPSFENSDTGDSSLSKSETRWPRPFQKTPNSIDDNDSPAKLESATPTYYSYKISSARPFELPKDKATPAPTIPTPFTTARSVKANVDSMINALQEIVDNQDYSSETPRPGLVIPPSAGPQTLHTLAQYFANALDGIAAEREKETGEELDKESKEKLTGLLTQMTMYRYNQLFKGSGTSDEDGVETTTAAADEELVGDTSNNLVETPELRELARNFSVALSDYLKNPDAFRKELENLRPTEPPSSVDGRTETTVGDEELLNFSDADSKSSFPPLFPTPQLPTATWGYIIAPESAGDLDVKNSLNPDLHTADTQSFVPGFNNLAVNTGKGFDKSEVGDNNKDFPGDHWTTSSGVTKLWQSALSINPAVLNENLDSTRSYSQTTEPYVAGTDSPPIDAPHSEVQYELRSLPKVSLNSTQVHGILIDFVNTTKTDDSNRLQRLLKKLNTSEDEFLHRMKEIESNPLTKRLILLLISECGANATKQFGTDPVADISEVIDSYSSHSAVVGGSEGRTVNSDIPELVDPSLKGDDQDTRALQLLNSLYAIASKFGK